MPTRWLGCSAVLSILTFLYIFGRVHGTCENGESNQTVTKTCSISVGKKETRKVEVKIDPDCNKLEKAWAWLWNTGLCDIKIRTVYRTVIVNTTQASQCEFITCCPGFISEGNFCQPGCENETYGEYCNISCTCPPNAYSQCDKHTGNCTCHAGLMGENCTESCPEGYYGDKCQQDCPCQNNASCHRETGHCNCTEPGWTGQYCEESCNGTYGYNCSQDCACNENQTCSVVDGSCQCKPGHIGIDCSDECEEEKFGMDCGNTCNCNTTTTAMCDKVTGHCDCKPGFIGQNCSHICPMGFYGKDCSEHCTCIGTPHCDHKNGTCICLGKQGTNCSEDCDTMHYGPDCKRVCNCSGANANGSCDPLIGSCHCKPGWEGVGCLAEKSSKNGRTDEQNSKDDSTTADLTVGLIISCCCLLVIVIIITILVYQRRRNRTFLNRAAVKQFKNAIYSTAQETVVINEVKQERKEELRNEIRHENASFKRNVGNEANRETASVQSKNYSTKSKKQSENEVIDLKAEEEVIKMKDPMPKVDLENQANSDTNSDQVDYDVPDMNNDIDSEEIIKDDSVHYSDVDSLPPEPAEQNVVKVDKKESVQILSDKHEQSDEEQYDSLENDIIKNAIRLPDYSSFEQVRKENESDSETENSYDKVILSAQTKKNTLNRNDYNTVNAVSKTIDKEPIAGYHHEQNNSVDKKKNSMPASAQNNQLDPIKNDNNTEYNVLDHTGKSFISRAQKNPYQPTEIPSNKISEKTNASVKVKVSKNDAEVKPSSEVKLGSQNRDTEDSEYSTLDHTGKSFHAAHRPENIYHTNKLLTKKDSDVSLISQEKDSSYVNKSSPNYESDIENRTAMEDSEYNTLDHTGKSFRSKNLPNDIYNNKGFMSQLQTNTLVSVDVTDPLADIQDEDSYSVCDIDNVDSADEEKGFTDDENVIYEIPDNSEDELKAEASGTCASKMKAKAEQRRVDDYEHFDVTFGN